MTLPQRKRLPLITTKNKKMIKKEIFLIIILCSLFMKLYDLFGMLLNNGLKCRQKFMFYDKLNELVNRVPWPNTRLRDMYAVPEYRSS